MVSRVSNGQKDSEKSSELMKCTHNQLMQNYNKRRHSKFCRICPMNDYFDKTEMCGQIDNDDQPRTGITSARWAALFIRNTNIIAYVSDTIYSQPVCIFHGMWQISYDDSTDKRSVTLGPLPSLNYILGMCTLSMTLGPLTDLGMFRLQMTLGPLW